MPMFRKKPVVIEARQYTGLSGNWHEIATWANATVVDNAMTIYTLEGEMVAEEGDWVIRGVAGEFYPIKDEIFRLTYEPQEEGGLWD